MGKALPLAFVDAGAPLSPVILAGDAMGANEIDAGGYGICAAHVGDDLARRSFETGAVVGRTVARLDGPLSGPRISDRSLVPTKPFSLLFP